VTRNECARHLPRDDEAVTAASWAAEHGPTTGCASRASERSSKRSKKLSSREGP